MSNEAIESNSSTPATEAEHPKAKRKAVKKAQAAASERRASDWLRESAGCDPFGPLTFVA